MSAFERVRDELRRDRRRWLVTGAAGFIGSNLVEELLRLDQQVIGIDNFATGYPGNLDEVHSLVGEQRWRSFQFIKADIRDKEACYNATTGIDYVLHQAALGSVPRSLADPHTTNEVNISGFLNILDASQRNGVRSFVYASSSSTYGDYPGLPKVEDAVGKLLSPYSVTKYANELYAGVFSHIYGLTTVGLRYFNVFGPRQDATSTYSAVIPKWVAAMVGNAPILIYGDGTTSRDFCFIANVVQANVLAATVLAGGKASIFNVACGDRTSLDDLFDYIRRALENEGVRYDRPAEKVAFRPGDVLHSQADIGRAQRALGYEPSHDIRAGLKKSISWYVRNLSAGGRRSD